MELIKFLLEYIGEQIKSPSQEYKKQMEISFSENFIKGLKEGRSKMKNGNEFVEFVKKEAKKNNLNVFVVTDNASGWSNTNNKVIKKMIAYIKKLHI